MKEAGTGPAELRFTSRAYRPRIDADGSEQEPREDAMDQRIGVDVYFDCV